MLKTIIKRDGRAEDFAPAKLNHWAIWAAAPLGDRVDWSDVVLTTVSQCPERMSSQELQQALIDECLLRKNWAYNVMAGSLYSVLLRKKMYGDFMPSVQDLYTKLRAKGFLRELTFTPEQWEQIEAIVDHSRDFKMAYFQIKQIVSKYSIQNKKTRVQYETPQYTFMRMALGLANGSPDHLKVEHIRMWYNNLSTFSLNAPTPNFNNLGTEHNGYASCCVYRAADTAASLAAGHHIAEVMTYMSAGIGGVEDCRSSGDPVRGGSIIHQGRLLPL